MVTDAARGKMADVLLQSQMDVSAIEKPLVNPIVKPYYRDGFGSKSIGEPEWNPHPRNVLSMPNRLDNTVRGGNGLDWFSSLRCAPAEEIKKSYSRPQEIAPAESKRHNEPAREEAGHIQIRIQPPEPVQVEREKPAAAEERPAIVYDNYDEFEEIYRRRPLEKSLRMSVGAKKKVFNKRNGFQAASHGDKSYQVPEYSLDFHKQGSTRPVINFGGSLRCVPDTFVPLEDLPLKPRPTFEEREKQRLKRTEITEVESLDQWKPANPLTPALQLPGSHG